MSTHSNDSPDILVWNMKGIAVFTFIDDNPPDDFLKGVNGVRPIRMKLEEYPAYREKCLKELTGGLDG